MKNQLVRLLFFLLVISMLSACGSTESSKNREDEEKSKEDSEEIIITHSMGEATIKTDPKRVVVLDPGALDNVLALGITPVGAPTMQLDMPFPEYLKDQTEDIEHIGTAYEPNIEAIIKLKPDVIFGNKQYHEKLYEQLEAVGPTVIVETAGTTWKENLKIQAQALGLEDKAEKLLNDYHGRIENYKSSKGKDATSTEISLLRANTENVMVYLRQSFSGSIIEELGFSRPVSQQKDDFALELNNEAIPEMDGDYIFWFTREQPNIIDSSFSNSPFWNNLEAVKNNKTFKVGYDTWLSGLGIQAANKIIDDVEKIIE
ncbi:ABC transporter substrate-binding protein [Neobacillus niacini]|uniref:ABC transporter substrate-binding protein n=1 Tax=Neobacillus niacini TaxID=86668 RepID=UPI0005EEB7CB|nr:iron-siderophore ABC transporter substrate-binding protein [Neobacillus niacini]